MKPLTYQCHRTSKRTGITHYKFQNDQYRLTIWVDGQTILYPLQLQARAAHCLLLPDITIEKDFDGIFTFPLGIHTKQAKPMATYLHQIPDLVKSVKTVITQVEKMQRTEENKCIENELEI